MAISQIAQGVFLVSPDKVDYRDTQAYRYTQIFSKATQRQLDLAREQALFNAKVGISAYETEMDVYRAEYTALSKRVGDADKSIARAAGDLLKAQLEIRKNAAKQGTAEAGAANKREEKRTEQQTVPQGSASSSRSTSSGGGGEGGKGGTAGAKADDAVLTASVTAAGTENAGTLVAEIVTRGREGDMSTADPKRYDKLLSDGVRTFITAEAARNEAKGSTPADARELAEISAEEQLENVSPAAWRAYSADKSKGLETAGDGGRTSQSSSSSRGFGSEQKPKYKDIADVILGATPERAAEILAMYTPEDLSGISEALKAQRETVAAELAGLVKPTLRGTDLITESRKILAGRFGPTRPLPPFAQRNALDAMLRMTDEQHAELLRNYRASLPADPTSPGGGGKGGGADTGGMFTPPPPAAPTETPTVPVSAAGIFSAPTTELDAFAAAPIPGTEGMRAPVRTPSLAESFLQSRAPQVYAEEAELPPLRVGRPVELGGGMAPSIGEKVEGPVPGSMRPALEFLPRRTQEYGLLGMDEETARALAQRDSMALAAASDAEFRRPAAAPVVTAPERVSAPAAVADAPTPMARGAAPPEGLGARVEGALLPRVQGPPGVPSGTPTQAALLEARGRGPLQGQTPGMITAGTNILERKSERTGAIGKAAKDLEAAAGAAGKTGVTAPADSWLTQRLNAAKTLADQPDKLKRMRASEAGRLAEQYFQADRSKGFSPFYTARTTIPAQMADTPDLRDRAAEVALAIALQDAASKNPK